MRLPASGVTVEPTTTFGDGVRHLHAVCRTVFSCDPPVIDSGFISAPTNPACQAAADARSSQLRATVAVAVAAEANFDSVAALNQRSAEAQAAVGATRGLTTIQQFNVSFTPVGPPNNPNGLLLERWDERWMCQNNVVDAAPATAQNDACGCNN